MKRIAFIFVIITSLIACTNESNSTQHKANPSSDSSQSSEPSESSESSTRTSQTSSEQTTDTSDKKATTANVTAAPDYDTTKWTDIHLVNSDIVIDMKYATTENFVEEVMYECGRCLLRPDVAKGVEKAQEILQQKKKGYVLKMLDCYRPRPVQQKLWDKVPNPMYVTPPTKGSMHNRGAAVDLTIVNDKGEELDMGTIFDFFGKRAHQDFMDLPDEVLDNRELLRSTMIKAGFKPIRTEWWHYYFAKGAPKKFAISDYLWECH